MSVETWIKEYMPPITDEIKADQLKATQHSLNKWKGLLSSNMEKHNICYLTMISEIDASAEWYPPIGEFGCALCQYSKRAMLKAPYGSFLFYCDYCPLYKTLGHNCTQDKSAYDRVNVEHPTDAQVAEMIGELILVEKALNK